MVFTEYAFTEAAINGKIVDKDQVAEQLKALTGLYRAVGVIGRDAQRLVNAMADDFYNGDRVGQFNVARRINDVTNGLTIAANVVQRRK